MNNLDLLSADLKPFKNDTFSTKDFFLIPSLRIQGEDNVLVLQTEDIVRLVLKIHENYTNII